jgi:uncharacterized metal-binding protein YceD (DUF177 family)
MSGLFTIPINGLKEGLHYYDFEINKEFFDQFEESEVKDGTLSVRIEAQRSSTHIDLNIKINGIVKICCDRCLVMFPLDIDCENRLLVKFGRTRDESDPDIITIPADEHELDMKQGFYEYIHLALPIQRIHPDDKNGNSTCDPDMLKRLKEHIIEEDHGFDPRWEELRKLINEN